MQSWIIALPRPDLEHCIQIGCFGKERLGDRLSEVSEGDGIACYALRESRIIALGTVTKGYYQEESAKFLKDGLFSHRFDFVANRLGELEINVGTLGDLASIPTGGNFGLVVKSGFRILTPEDWNLFCDRAGLPDLKNPEAVKLDVARQWWWVNQGQTYKTERNGNYIWAPQRTKADQEAFHHLNVARVRSGDVTLHYVDGKVVSTSIAKSDAVQASRPADLPSQLWSEEGYKVEAEYFDLKPPIARDDIPIDLRLAMGREAKSPFNKGGTLNQGYLFSLPVSFVEQLSERFPQLLPPGISINNQTNFKSQLTLLDKFLKEIEKLRVNNDGNNNPRLYKPALLLAIVNAIDTKELSDNKIIFDRILPKFAQVLAKFGLHGDEHQAAKAFFHLQNEPFWRLALNDASEPPSSGDLAQVRSRINHGYFLSDYWLLLKDARKRETIKKTILKHWFSTSRLELKSNEKFDYPSAAAQLILDIETTGFKFEPWQLACYITALRTKPFLILAGVSGSGKSQLPQLVATASSSHSTLIPVRPDWTDSSDLIGYVQLQGNLRTGMLLELAQKAMNNPSEHFICVIDEMNLARVEHYFAEVLSRLEQSRSSGGKSESLLSHNVSEEDNHWKEVSLPENLALIGTVNMDESTHGFSRKVLDRAFTLEFSEVDLTNWQITISDVASRAQWPVHAWLPRATRLATLSNISSEDLLVINQCITALVELNEILEQAQLQLAYRSRDEIVLFVLHANEIIELFKQRNGDRVDPLDLAIQMKVLPRIAGGSGSIRRLVLELLGWSWSAGRRRFKNESDAEDLIKNWVELRRPYSMKDARFPRTCARLCLMWERILNESYTSFWL